MKKTYLIKDQGKGLIENLTPDKLIDIASGTSSSGQVGNYIPLSGTEEIKTGGTWINGKPIYRKCISLDTFTESISIPHNINGIERLIEARLLTDHSMNATNAVVYNLSRSGGPLGDSFVTPDNIEIENPASTLFLSPIFILEYTKII